MIVRRVLHPDVGEEGNVRSSSGGHTVIPVEVCNSVLEPGRQRRATPPVGNRNLNSKVSSKVSSTVRRLEEESVKSRYDRSRLGVPLGHVKSQDGPEDRETRVGHTDSDNGSHSPRHPDYTAWASQVRS